MALLIALQNGRGSSNRRDSDSSHPETVSVYVVQAGCADQQLDVCAYKSADPAAWHIHICLCALSKSY
jgi:hypothetical protein